MKNFIVNYQKEIGKDGAIYNQTIKTSRELAEKFNKYVEKLKNETSKKFICNNNDIKILYNLKMLQQGKNYINLTTIDYFKGFYIKEIYQPPKKDKDIERILLNRNTIIKVL